MSTAVAPSHGILEPLERLNDELSRFAVRVVQEALSAALPATWRRRADDLEAARPRPGDWHGAATAAELAERDRKLATEAEACRMHAELLTRYPHELILSQNDIVRALGGAA